MQKQQLNEQQKELINKHYKKIQNNVKKYLKEKGFSDKRLKGEECIGWLPEIALKYDEKLTKSFEAYATTQCINKLIDEVRRVYKTRNKNRPTFVSFSKNPFLVSSVTIDSSLNELNDIELKERIIKLTNEKYGNSNKNKDIIKRQLIHKYLIPKAFGESNPKLYNVAKEIGITLGHACATLKSKDFKEHFKNCLNL